MNGGLVALFAGLLCMLLADTVVLLSVQIRGLGTTIVQWTASMLSELSVFDFSIPGILMCDIPLSMTYDLSEHDK